MKNDANCLRTSPSQYQTTLLYFFHSATVNHVSKEMTDLRKEKEKTITLLGCFSVVTVVQNVIGMCNSFAARDHSQVVTCFGAQRKGSIHRDDEKIFSVSTKRSVEDRRFIGYKKPDLIFAGK